MKLDKVTARDYQLTIRVPIKALDDPNARKAAHEIVEKMGPIVDDLGAVTKLQGLVSGAPPRGVQL